jgi:branched-chain amino acid transport system permease protein
MAVADAASRPAAKAPGRWAAVAGAVIALAVLAALPFMLNGYFLRLATTVMMYGVLSWSWNFIGGFAGYPSFGTAAFFGFGAYTGALLLTHKYVAFWMSPIAGGLASLLAAAIVGGPILRLRGHYFAVASLAVGAVFQELAMSWTDLTGGGMGVNLPPLGTSFVSESKVFYYAMMALAVFAYIVTEIVARGRLGVALRCIRQNEEAANMIGIDATRSKVIAFALSAGFAGAAGAIYASWIAYIDPSDVFDILIAIKAPVMVLLGGAGTVFGPLLGAVVYLAFEEVVWRNLLQFHAAVLGAIIVALVLFMPSGILDVLRRRKRGGRP